MADRARRGPAAATGGRQRFTTRDAANGRVGDEARSRIAHSRLRHVFGRLDDPHADRLLLSIAHGKVDLALHPHGRDHLGLDDADVLRHRDRREVARDFLDLLRRHRLGGVLHLPGVGLPRVRAVAQSLLEVAQLLHDVVVGETLDRRVLGTPASVGQVAQAARARPGGLALRHDVGHRRVTLGKPVRGTVAVADLLLREPQCRPFGLQQHGRRRIRVWRRRRAIRGRRLRRHLVRHHARRQLWLRVGPGWRHLPLCLHQTRRPQRGKRSDGEDDDACSHGQSSDSCNSECGDAFALQAASTSFSRSADRPALSFALRSAGHVSTYASVSRTVSASGRWVSPLAIAAFTLTWPPPASSPVRGTHTGMSLHGRTFCSSRNAVGTHTNCASDFETCLHVSSRRPIVSPPCGPSALKMPIVRFSRQVTMKLATSRTSMHCT